MKRHCDMSALWLCSVVHRSCDFRNEIICFIYVPSFFCRRPGFTRFCLCMQKKKSLIVTIIKDFKIVSFLLTLKRKPCSLQTRLWHSCDHLKTHSVTSISSIQAKNYLHMIRGQFLSPGRHFIGAHQWHWNRSVSSKRTGTCLVVSNHIILCSRLDEPTFLSLTEAISWNLSSRRHQDKDVKFLKCATPVLPEIFFFLFLKMSTVYFYN